MVRFHIINLGCKVNRVESDAIMASLLKRGFEYSDLSAAEVVLVNTCTVTGEAGKKTRKMVRRALNQPQVGCVVVTGCAVAIDAQSFLDMDERIVVQPDKSKVVDSLLDVVAPDERFDAFFGASVLALDYDASAQEPQSLDLRVGERYPTRVGVKIQDGCNNACSFCIVHVARGKAWSRPEQEVLTEICALDKLGVREIVLTGINLGSYRFEGKRLEDLLEDIISQTSQVRLRISSIEPRDVTDALIACMARYPHRIIQHLHLPLQSGSTEILRAMRRPYTKEQFLELVDKLYAALPKLALSSDIICGFPGETEEQFQETCDVVKQARFMKCHIFPYSVRQNTPAALMPNQIDSKVKAQRCKRLAAFAQVLRQEEYDRRVGSHEWVLVESGEKAMTESYFEISYDGDAQPGDLIYLKLEAQVVA